MSPNGPHGHHRLTTRQAAEWLAVFLIPACVINSTVNTMIAQYIPPSWALVGLTLVSDFLLALGWYALVLVAFIKWDRRRERP